MSKYKRIDNDQIDVHLPESGYSVYAAAQDTDENLVAMGARDFSDELWIEPKDWKELAAENDKLGLWAEDVRNRFTNQSPSHECTCHSLVQSCESAINIQYAGKQNAVFLSPLSVYAEVNPNIRGGANCLRVLATAMNRGVLPDKIQPNNNKFDHDLIGTAGKGNAQQSSGRWVPLRDFPDGWAKTARKFRPLEVINPRTIEEAVCSVLHRRVINVGREGHAVPWNKLVWQEGEVKARDPRAGLMFHYPDSYDVVRYDTWSRASRAIGGASCIWSMTDWR